MAETHEEIKLPYVVIIEPEELQFRLIQRMLRNVKSFRFKMYAKLVVAAEEMDEVGTADLVVLPIHGDELGLFAALRDLQGHHEEPHGVQYAIALRAHFPEAPIMFYTGGAPLPRMCVESRRNTFYQTRLGPGQFENAILGAIRIARERSTEASGPAPDSTDVT